jgi:hypothetical protein
MQLFPGLIYEKNIFLAGLSIFLGRTYTPTRVGRVLSFFSSSRNWDSPNPSPAGQYAPLVLGGGTQAGEGGVGRVPIPTRGHTLWYSLYIRILWVVHISNAKEKKPGWQYGRYRSSQILYLQDY